MPRSAPVNPAAVISLVAGILGWTVLPVLGALVAIATGHLAVDRIRRAAGAESGRTLARIGLALGWLQALVLLAGLGVWLVMLVMAGAISSVAIVAVVLFGMAAMGALAMLLSVLFFGFA